jgi:hypothetical protein
VHTRKKKIMNCKMAYFLTCIVIIFYASCLRANLTSADLSCSTPVIIDSSTVITLDYDVSITDTCELIVAGSMFGNSQVDTVTFTSDTGNKLVIAGGGIWDPSTFNTETKHIQFLNGVTLAINSGGILKLYGPLDIVGALLALYRGAIVWFNNGTITNQGTIQTIASGQ